MKYLHQFFIVIFFLTASLQSIAQEATAQIKQIWVERDAMVNGMEGIKIHSHFDIQNMKDKGGQVTAWFYYDDGRPLQGTTVGKRTSQGQLAILTTITPKYDRAIFNDVWIFIPYDEFSKTLQQNGTYPLQFRVGIHDHNRKQLDISDMQIFTYILKKEDNFSQPQTNEAKAQAYPATYSNEGAYMTDGYGNKLTDSQNIETIRGQIIERIPTSTEMDGLDVPNLYRFREANGSISFVSFPKPLSSTSGQYELTGSNKTVFYNAVRKSESVFYVSTYKKR